MHRFKKILLVDPGPQARQQAFDVARGLAERNGGSLTVFSAVEDASPSLARVLGLARREELSREAIEEVREEISDLGKGVSPEGPPLQFDATAGNPFLEIHRRVVRDAYDLVVAAADGQSSSWWGSTTAHLLRKCPVPVWVLRPEPTGRYERVLLALDAEDEQESARQLGQRLVQIASSLAVLHDAELHVVTVWNVYGENLLQGRFGYDREELDRVRDETRADIERHISTFLAEIPEGGPEPRLHLECGQAAEKIAEVAREMDADMLVTGTLGRTGISGLLIGNTAESVLARVRCPLIAVKPEGFVSPVIVAE